MLFETEIYNSWTHIILFTWKNCRFHGLYKAPSFYLRISGLSPETKYAGHSPATKLVIQFVTRSWRYQNILEAKTVQWLDFQTISEVLLSRFDSWNNSSGASREHSTLEKESCSSRPLHCIGWGYLGVSNYLGVSSILLSLNWICICAVSCPPFASYFPPLTTYFYHLLFYNKMVYPDTFTGFQIEDPKHWTEFHKNELTPKPFEDYDVDIKIQACGVCASDLHTISMQLL